MSAPTSTNGYASNGAGNHATQSDEPGAQALRHRGTNGSETASVQVLQERVQYLEEATYQLRAQAAQRKLQAKEKSCDVCCGTCCCCATCCVASTCFGPCGSGVIACCLSWLCCRR